MGRNPLSGEVFIFYNTNRTPVEAAPLGTRRLRDLSQALRARYSHASLYLNEGTGGYPITWRELVMMIEGVELTRLRSRKRYDISLKNSANNTRISL